MKEFTSKKTALDLALAYAREIIDVIDPDVDTDIRTLEDGDGNTTGYYFILVKHNMVYRVFINVNDTTKPLGQVEVYNLLINRFITNMADPDATNKIIELINEQAVNAKKAIKGSN